MGRNWKETIGETLNGLRKTIRASRKKSKMLWRPVKRSAVLYTDRHLAKLLPAAIWKIEKQPNDLRYLAKEICWQTLF